MKYNLRMPTRFASTVLFSICIISSGCATLKPQPMTPEQRSMVKTSLGHIGIVNAAYQPSVKLQIPAKGAMSGAGKGMVSGAAAPLSMLSDCNGEGCGYLAILAIAAVPVTTVIGGVGGAITAESRTLVEASEASLGESMSKLKIQETFAAEVLGRIKKVGVLDSSLIKGNGPASPYESVSYASLGGIDTVKELAVKSFELSGDGRVNPQMSLKLIATVRLITKSSGKEIYSKAFTCTGGKAIFTEWAADNGRMLSEKTEGCYGDLADQIVTDIFVMDSLARQ